MITTNKSRGNLPRAPSNRSTTKMSTTFTTIAEACEHITANHPELGYPADPTLNGEPPATKLRNLNSLHELLHNQAAANGTAGPAALKLV
jgi:hypothetical protein